MTATLEQLLETLVRPALRAHNGDVELVGYQDGILRLRMLGQCAGCPAAAMTNETLIEGQLMPLLPDLKEVILVHTVDASLLAEAGNITNQKKTLHRGQSVATFLMGTRRLYDYVDNNPAVAMYPVQYVNDPYVIAQNDNLVSINSCVQIDLMGQVVSTSVGLRQISGVGGQIDFVRGANMSKGGRAIMAMPSTTCGTGSEVTNISILALLSRRTKKGLAHESMFADQAVLIPELLKGLPFSVFATSSIDALIHAIESSLSPKASATTKLFGYQAIAWILKGYLAIRDQGPDARFPLLSQFLLASNYAGIAFGNAGCAAVHALSYPLGAVYHVPHGESNYAMFTGVMKQYLAIRSDGAIAELNAFLAQLLDCPPEAVYEALEDLLSCLLPKKALHEYGMQEHELAEFTDSVLANQQRLLQNNFVPLSREQIYAIYRSLY